MKLKSKYLLIIGYIIWTTGYISANETPVLSKKTYHTTQSALKKIFPTATSITAEKMELSKSEKKIISNQLNFKTNWKNITVYQGYENKTQLGKAFILNELGKYYPITMMVHITPQQNIGAIIVMVYREQIGRNIRKKRFLKQFVGKTKDSPLKISHDIDGITGATISSWSVARASKKALLLAYNYEKKDPK